MDILDKINNGRYNHIDNNNDYCIRDFIKGQNPSKYDNEILRFLDDHSHEISILILIALILNFAKK
jgi:hypothetical protein